jgi:hypothetical protein
MKSLLFIYFFSLVWKFITKIALSIKFIFISPQTIHGQLNEKNYIDGEKGHFAELVSNLLKLIATKLTKSANFADYSPNHSPKLTVIRSNVLLFDYGKLVVTTQNEHYIVEVIFSKVKCHYRAMYFHHLGINDFWISPHFFGSYCAFYPVYFFILWKLPMSTIFTCANLCGDDDVLLRVRLDVMLTT